MRTDSLKKQVIREIKSEIDHWNFTRIERYGVEVSEVSEFLKDVKDGTLDAVINYNYWYYEPSNTPILFATLFSWYLNRKKIVEKYGIVNAITPDNLVAFKNIYQLLNSPDFFECQDYIKLLLERIMVTEYSWIDTLRRLKEISKLDVAIDLTSLNELFSPIEQTRFKKGNQSREIFMIRDAVINVLQGVNYTNIGSIFQNQSKNYYEEYIRRMIMSQLDILKMIKARKHIDYFLPEYIDGYYEDIFRTVTDRISREDTDYDEVTRNMLFFVPDSSLVCDSFKTIEYEKMVNDSQLSVKIAKGVLKSFNVPFEKLNLREQCQKIQGQYGLENAQLFIGDNCMNMISLANGERLLSAYNFEIPHLFCKWQGLYDILYDRGTDEEFISGCAYIMCDITTTQIFIEGNKRTAKALFNAMLCSRRLIPPVIDMLEDEHKLFQNIVFDRENHYENVIDMILEETIMTWNQFASGTFSKPLTIRPLRPENPILQIY